MDSSATRRFPLLLSGYLIFLAVIVVMADTSSGTRVWGFIHTLPGGDKVGHFFLFGMLSLIVNLMVSRRRCLATGIVFLLVLLEEVSQIWLPNRNFDLGDIVADAAGVIFFSVFAYLIMKRKIVA